MINATEKQIEDAFTRWEQQYRENPTGFMDDGQRLTKESPRSYGELCAAYFIKLLTGEV